MFLGGNSVSNLKAMFEKNIQKQADAVATV